MRRTGGIVLCGGRSRRMGRDKAGLPFGRETLLERVAGRLAPSVDALCVVAREGQPLPAALPEGCGVARDAAEGRGPLAGLVAGLEHLGVERAFLCACDAPLLRPALVGHLLTLANEPQPGAGGAERPEIVVPRVDGHFMVTTAVYARSVLPAARRLLAAGRLRPRFLLDECRTRVVDAAELRAVDPGLESLLDCDTPEEYRAALARAGLAATDAARARPGPAAS